MRGADKAEGNFDVLKSLNPLVGLMGEVSKAFQDGTVNSIIPKMASLAPAQALLHSVEITGR